MSDYIIRATAANNSIRAFAATTRDLVEHGREVHNISPVATAALGRLLTAGAMMGSMMKGEKDLLTLQRKGDGPMGGVTVTADANANVKGYVDNGDFILPPNAQGKLDVGGSIGNGILTVIKDMGLKDPYVGQVELVSGEIAQDLTYYYAVSEQIPSSIALGVLMNKDNTVKCAGGFMIQLLPFAEEELIDKLEKRISEISSITKLLDDGNTPEMILEYILGDFDLQIHEKVETRFHCNCSKERVEKAIVSIGKKDLEEMIADNEPLEVNCHFCNTNYHFQIDELKKLI